MSDNHDSRSGSSWWDKLASVKLAVSLLVILASSAIIGTILPQDQPALFYHKAYSSAWARLILAAQLDRVYTSIWFVLLLSALALNLIICSLDRLPKTWRSVFKMGEAEIRRLPKLRLKRSFTAQAGPDQALAAVRAELARFKSFDSPILENPALDTPPATVLLAQAGRLSRLGAYVVHLSILVFFAAGVASGLGGFKGYVQLYEGQAADHLDLRSGGQRPLGFTLRLDKFTFEQYPTGAPKTFQSDLSFLQDGKVVQTAQAVVNGPARFGGITFYQSNYGQGLDWVEIEVEPKGGPARTIRLKEDEIVEVEGLGQVEVLEFHARMRDLGPAVRLGLAKTGGAKPEAFWVLSKPPFQMRAQAAEVFKLKSFAGRYYSGLQANSDPGVALVWLGGGLMILGLLAALLWSHRRLWIEVRPQAQGVRVSLAGSTHRDRPGFERQFEALARRLEATLAGPAKEKER